MRLPPSAPGAYSSGKLDNLQLGPAMRALNPRERALVDYLLETGTSNWTEAVTAAGYIGTYDGLRVQAAEKRKDPKIHAALTEVGKQRLALGIPIGLKAVMDAARDPSHKDSVRAGLALLAMNGISPITKSENATVVTHTLDPLAAIEAKLALLPPEVAAAIRLTLPGAAPPLMIDVTPVGTIENVRAGAEVTGLSEAEADELLADLL